jgi:hypothetical protein
MNCRIVKYALLGAVIFVSTVAQASTITTLYTPPAGDATYAWNTRYGPWGYTAGGTEIGIYLTFGGQWGNDHTIAIFEVPIADLAGETLLDAELIVNSTGFGTNYYYGTAYLGWLDVGSTTLTGDVVADGLGPLGGALSQTWTIYNSDLGNGAAGVKTFDATACVQADLDAGRSYSTFMLHGSRETWGNILTAEAAGGLSGPQIVAETIEVPEPATLSLLALGCAALILRRRK